MIAKTDSRKPANPERAFQFFKWYAHSIATIFGLIGVTLLFLSFYGHNPWLEQPDALFGLTNWIWLALAGLFHLTLCGFLFAVQSLIVQALVPLWVGSNYLIYLVGMVWAMRMTVPFPVAQFMARRFGINPETLDVIWYLFIAYLATGSFVLLFFKLRQWKQVKNEMWLKDWQQRRDQTLLSEKTTKLPVNAGSYVKISCPACDGHLEFPAHALGQKISCPHCKTAITLKESL